MKARRLVAAVCGAVAALGATLLPTSADVPVAIVFTGVAGTGGQSSWNVADWPFPECDPTQKVWTWFGATQANVDMDTTEGIYAGDVGLNATMTSVTPCALLDTGTMTLSAVHTVTVGVGVNCLFSGTFMRVATEITMLLSGGCSVNDLPSVPVSLLQGHMALFLGTPQPIPLCGCALYTPNFAGIEFSTALPTG